MKIQKNEIEMAETEDKFSNTFDWFYDNSLLLVYATCCILYLFGICDEKALMLSGLGAIVTYLHSILFAFRSMKINVQVEHEEWETSTDED